MFSVIKGEEGILYAGTNQGLFISKDIGATWKQAQIKDTDGTTLKSDFYIEYAKENNFIATINTQSEHETMYLFSKDGGKRWYSFNRPSSCYFFRNIVYSSDGIIYATSSSKVGSEIYKTTNDGKNWSVYNITDRDVDKLFIDNKGTLFATVGESFKFNRTNYYNLYRSTNEGKTWTLLKLKHIRNLVFKNKGCIIAFDAGYTHVSPKEENTEAHYISSDNGNTWEEIFRNNITDEFRSVICSDETILQVGWATIYSEYTPGETWLLSRSIDLGKTWNSTGISGEGISNISACYLWFGKSQAIFIPPEHNNLFYISDDNGKSWKPKIVQQF